MAVRKTLLAGSLATLAAAQSSTVNLFFGPIDQQNFVASVVSAGPSEVVYSVGCGSSPSSSAIAIDPADVCGIASGIGITVTAGPGPTPTREQFNFAYSTVLPADLFRDDPDASSADASVAGSTLSASATLSCKFAGTTSASCSGSELLVYGSMTTSTATADSIPSDEVMSGFQAVTITAGAEKLSSTGNGGSGGSKTSAAASDGSATGSAAAASGSSGAGNVLSVGWGMAGAAMAGAFML